MLQIIYFIKLVNQLQQHTSSFAMQKIVHEQESIYLFGIFFDIGFGLLVLFI